MKNFIFSLIIIAPFLVFSFYHIVNYVDIAESRKLQLEGHYYVVFVIDGDTIRVRKEGENKTIRLIGINAPEIRLRHRRIENECFGPEAKRFLRKQIQGKYVRIEKDVLASEKDRHGRLLRHIFFEGISVNQKLIKEGYAVTTRHKEHEFLVDFLYLEKVARMNRVGLWKDCN